MKQSTIDNDDEHAIAISCIEVLMDNTAILGREDTKVFIELATAIEQYEKKRWPLW